MRGMAMRLTNDTVPTKFDAWTVRGAINFHVVAIGTAVALMLCGSLASASPSQSSASTVGANNPPADELVSRAVASLPSSGWQRFSGQEDLISYYLEAGRCKDALQTLAAQDASRTEDPAGPRMTAYKAQLLAASANRAGSRECAVELSRRWAGLARDEKRLDGIAGAGAFLRAIGNDAEGAALIREAEAGVRDPLTRTSQLWSIRRQVFRFYEGTDILGSELERSALELLAAPPSDDEQQVQPAAGQLVEMLFETGNAPLARLVANSECVRGTIRTILCGAGGYLDRDLERLSTQIATGSPAEQKNAMNMLYRNGAIDRIAPHFPRIVEIEEGNKAAAFRTLAFYSHSIWSKSPAIAEVGARQALALGLTGPDKARGLDASSWHVWNAHLAKILAGAGDDRAVKDVLRRAKPGRKERELYFSDIASGYARFGDEAAVQRSINAIADEQAQRRAWWEIALGTPSVPIESRLRAADRARSILYVADPKAGYGYVGPPPGVVNCGELGGAEMIASEGAPVEALLTFAKFSEEAGPHGICAYRRFLLRAAAGTGKDERAKQIALELLRTTDRPCVNMSCDDLKVLQLLVDLRMYDEAERLAMMFEQANRTGPLLMIARGMITKE